MIILDWLIALAWIGFWSYWFVGAVRAGSKATGNPFIGWRFRLIFIILITLLTSNLSHHHVNLHYELSQNRHWLKILGTALVIVSLGLAAWGRKQLGSNWGRPMSSHKGTSLVTSGPYAFVRNPMYTGLIFALLGSFLALNIVWIFPFIFGTIIFGYSAFQEDKTLAKKFPKTYPAYKARTKMLIPYII